MVTATVSNPIDGSRGQKVSAERATRSPRLVLLIPLMFFGCGGTPSFLGKQEYGLSLSWSCVQRVTTWGFWDTLSSRVSHILSCCGSS